MFRIQFYTFILCSILNAGHQRSIIQVPTSGYSTLDKDAGHCRILAGDSNVLKGKIGGVSIYVKDCSGWYANDLAIGFSNQGQKKPTRGVKIRARTQGYRFYGENRSFRQGLPWLMDVNQDGNSEVIIWESFGDTQLGRLNSAGLIPWAYKYKSNQLSVDTPSTCQLISAMVVVHLQTIEEVQMRTRYKGRREWHDWVIHSLDSVKFQLCGGRS